MKYLINLTFYAGSDDKEDTDRGVYLIETEQTLTKEQIQTAITETNALCNVEWASGETIEEIIEGLELEELDSVAELVRTHPNFQSSYENGLNIDTLTEGLAEYLDCKIEKIENNAENITADAMYEIEQWQ